MCSLIHSFGYVTIGIISFIVDDESIQILIYFMLLISISEGRAIFIGYFPASRTISVVVVNPYQNRDLSPSILEKQYRDACQALSIQPPPRNGITFRVSFRICLRKRLLVSWLYFSFSYFISIFCLFSGGLCWVCQGC